MKFAPSVEPIWKRDAFAVMRGARRGGGRGGFLLELELAFEDSRRCF